MNGGVALASDDDRPLSGRAALVTGASRRVGRAIAEALAAAGATLALHAHRSVDDAHALALRLRAAGARVHVLVADLTDAGACARLVADAQAALGGLDLLVNNAARLEATPLASLDVEAFDRLMAVNARPVFTLSLEAGRRMQERGGAIVNVACTSALTAWGGFIPYSVSKAAVVSLTQGFARALAPRVRVNAVAPGPVLPPPGLSAQEAQRIADTTLLKRWGDPTDVAAAVLFLATAPWLTGVVLPVDGGRTAR